MKFMCLGHLDSEKMNARSKEEIDAVMRDCQLHIERPETFDY